jgi:putative ABC transport system permease protein
VRCQYRIVSSGFFESMGIPLIRGRVFDERDRPADGNEGQSMIAVVGTALAERLWPTQDPIGGRLLWNNPRGPLVEVIGVVGEIRDTVLDAEPIPTIYLNVDQLPWPSMTLLVKTEGDPTVFAPAILQAISRVDGSLAPPTTRLLTSNLAEATAGPRLNAQLIGIFSAVALLIAAIGVYGALSYRVTRRHRDFGIRMVMGAGRGELMRMMLGQGLRLVAIGVAIGVLGSIGLTRFLASVLYQTSTTDPVIFAVVPLTFTVVAAFACYLPARRAANVDPWIALRAE